MAGFKRWCHGVGGLGFESPEFAEGLEVIVSNRKKIRRMRTRVMSHDRRMRVIILTVELKSSVIKIEFIQRDRLEYTVIYKKRRLTQRDSAPHEMNCWLYSW